MKTYIFCSEIFIDPEYNLEIPYEIHYLKCDSHIEAHLVAFITNYHLLGVKEETFF